VREENVTVTSSQLEKCSILHLGNQKLQQNFKMELDTPNSVDSKFGTSTIEVIPRRHGHKRI